MNKKVVSCFVLLLIALFSFVIVSANLSSDRYSDTVIFPNDEYVPGDSYLRFRYHIYKGWNLVPHGENGDSPSRSRNKFAEWGDEILGCSIDGTFRGWQIKYQFDYLPGYGYIGGELNPGTGDLEEPYLTELGEALTDFYWDKDVGPLSLAPLQLSSRWFYSEMDCNYPLSSIRQSILGNTQYLEYFKLNKGWNFITIAPAFVGHEFGDITGDCEITKMNQWDPLNQKWRFSSSESENEAVKLMSYKVTQDDIQTPLLLKVREDCNLGSSNQVPPAVPN